jgi:uncharacterized repeat protein (TIGR03803 family)
MKLVDWPRGSASTVRAVLVRAVRLLVLTLTVPVAAAGQVPVDVLHTFAPGEPTFPNALVTAPDGSVYGTSEGGGFFDGGAAFNAGTVFRVADDGAIVVVRSFDENLRRPRALVFAAGALFGLADGPSARRGAVFAMNPDGSQFRVVHVFSDTAGGGNAGGTLVRGTDGLLYGVSPDAGSGRIYQLNPSTGDFAVLHAFTQTEGQVTFQSPLIAGSDGNLYGLSGGGAVYKLAPSGAFTVLKRFACGIDAYCEPIALPGVVDGTLFVEMANRGLARVPTGGGAATFASLPGTARWLGWILAGDGHFYAVRDTQILRLSPQGQAVIIRTLGPGESTFGDLWPVPMALAADGRIIGATSFGGDHGRGRIFRFATDGTFAWLHSMIASTDGSLPTSLVRGADGTLYGTTGTGGAFDRGTAFRIAADGTFSVLHSFSGGADGGWPIGIVLATDGNLYGTALTGGTGNGGVLFRMSTDGTVTPLHAFAADTTVRPRNVPMQGSDGALYGTTATDIYRCGLDGTFALVHTFDEYSIIPGDPSPLTSFPLTEIAGVLYGAAVSYNAIGDGLPPSDPFVFALTLTGAYHRVAVFDPAFDLTGALVAGRDGNLYGTTRDTFFRVTPSGSRTNLFSLPASGALSGRAFTSALMPGPDGEFYCGFTPDLDTSEPGGVCRVTPAGEFSRITDRIPNALALQADGFIAGVNHRRGLRAEGPAAIFRFTLPPLMALDFPRPAALTGHPFLLAGWAIDRASATGAGVDAVHVWAFRAGGGAPIFVGTPEYGRPRSDIGSIYGARFTNSGFDMAVTGLTPGSYTLVAYAHSTATNTFSQSRTVEVTVTGPTSQPAISIDIPGEGATAGLPFAVAGWAIDRGAPSGAGVDAVHVYAFNAAGTPTFLGVGSYGAPRGDVGAVYGAPFTNSGFSLSTSTPLAPGGYTLVVYARSVVSGSWFWQTRTITVREPGDPLMTIDVPSAGASVRQPFALAGWAIDRDAPSGPGVDTIHAWAYPVNGDPPIFVAAGPANVRRADVGAAFGAQFTDSGYGLIVSGLPPGQYHIAVHARSTVTGTFNQSRVVTVTIVP